MEACDVSSEPTINGTVPGSVTLLDGLLHTYLAAFGNAPADCCMSDTLKAPFSFVVSLPQTLPGQSRALFGQSRALLGQDAVKLPPPCCSMRNTALGGGSTSPAIDCTEGVKLSMLAHEFADPPSPLGVRLLTIATAAGSVLFSTVGLLAVTSLSGLTTSEYVRILSLSTSHWTLYMPFFGQSSGSCTTTPLYHVPWYSTSTRDPTWIALDSALADGVAMSSVGMLLCWLVVCTTTSGIASLTLSRARPDVCLSCVCNPRTLGGCEWCFREELFTCIFSAIWRVKAETGHFCAAEDIERRGLVL
mmetsp:Transcript_33112/g.52674  ORF Transcript_33112/g.52674 Transcript_33112/m.52674 type:complete len:304 (+) Transcript_33112:592-1503(+)